MKTIKKLIASMLIKDKAIKDKQGISLKEVRPYLMVVLGITATRKTDFSKFLYILEKRFLDIGRNNGTTFLFYYLKGVSHITIRYFALTPLYDTLDSKVLIKVDRQSGLPSIFPKSLRDLIQTGNRSSDIRYIVALLSFISIFRSLPTKVPVSLSTITDPFNGKSDTLPEGLVKDVLNNYLGIYSLKINKAQTFYTTKAGPNSKNSLGGAEIDAFALLHQPSVLIPYLKFLGCSKSVLFIIGYILIIILGSPYYGVSRLFKFKYQIPCNGRLSVVYNQAGKARVVAMTNGGIQCAFKPLHHSIFNILEDLKTDATFDQKGVLLNFIKLRKGKTFFCYDLSAATDRLPVRLQKDILNILGFPGSLGSDIITSIDGNFKSKSVRYSVGQPMGAYSSWAMLALTHHLIILSAAKIAGKDKSFSEYLVLGDDVIIADEEVAKVYLELMDQLGVSINLSKSIISNEICEFAKLWINPSYDISPLGSGLLVQSIRDRSSFVSLVTQAYERNLLTGQDILSSYKDAPKVVKPKLQFALGHITLIKINRYINETLNEKYSIKVLLTNIGRLSLREDTGMYFRWAIETHKGTSGFTDRNLENNSLIAICKVLEEEGSTIFRRNLKVLIESFRQLLFYSGRVSSLRIGMPDFFDLILLPIKPGIGIHVSLLVCGLGELLYGGIFHSYILFYEKYLTSGRNPSLTLYQKLGLYCVIVDLNSKVHFYEEEISKKKELSKLFHDLQKNELIRSSLNLHIKAVTEQKDLSIFSPEMAYYGPSKWSQTRSH